MAKVLKMQFKKAGIKVQIVYYENPEKWADAIYRLHDFDLALCEKTVAFKERSLIYWLKEMGHKALMLEQSDLFSARYWEMQQSKDEIFKKKRLNELFEMISEEKRCIFLVHPLNYYAFNNRIDISGINFAYSFYMRDLSRITLTKGEADEVPGNQKGSEKCS